MDDPWGIYNRQPLASGYSYVLGLETIRTALTGAGARVDDLWMWLPDLPHRLEWWSVLTVDFAGDGGSRYYVSGEGRYPLMSLHCTAVPSQLRPVIRDEVEEVWLPQACQWVCDAAGRGNAWTATRHSWILTYRDDALRLTST